MLDGLEAQSQTPADAIERVAVRAAARRAAGQRTAMRGTVDTEGAARLVRWAGERRQPGWIGLLAILVLGLFPAVASLRLRALLAALIVHAIRRRVARPRMRAARRLAPEWVERGRPNLTSPAA